MRGFQISEESDDSDNEDGGGEASRATELEAAVVSLGYCSDGSCSLRSRLSLQHSDLEHSGAERRDQNIALKSVASEVLQKLGELQRCLLSSDGTHPGEEDASLVKEKGLNQSKVQDQDKEDQDTERGGSDLQHGEGAALPPSSSSHASLLRTADSEAHSPPRSLKAQRSLHRRSKRRRTMAKRPRKKTSKA